MTINLNTYKEHIKANATVRYQGISLTDAFITNSLVQ